MNLEQIKETLLLRAFTFIKIPLINWLRPVVVQLDDNVCRVRIPLDRRTHNHLGSMYFGALSTGADLAGGLVALREIRHSRKKINFVFKDFQANFLKRATGDVIFTCHDVPLVKDLVNRAANSTERIEGAFDVIATVPSQFGDEPVAKFRMTISMKRKG